MTVNAQELEPAQSRTDAKLRYAAIHFEELRNVERRGNDFERAHQESFLFHIFGVGGEELVRRDERFWGILDR